MEEFANLLWVGYKIAERGPSIFQELWGLLRQSATHYIYGLNADAEACEKAARQIREYAVKLENLVIQRTVRSLLLVCFCCLLHYMYV